MPERTVEDLLREEYFDLLPQIRRTAEYLEAQVSYHVLPIATSLKPFERIQIKARVKECDSAVDSLRRDQEAATFDPSLTYTLETLNDLAAVRVLAFPRSRLAEIDNVLRREFKGWTEDHVREDDDVLAFKYWGSCPTSRKVRGEYQVVSMLTGLFWEIEHGALYKPPPQLRAITRPASMNVRSKEVLRALGAFEDEFERLLAAAETK
jgi:ppGpp synthetase/RelA/SpoT-type nucleotidyltranferase